MVAAEWDAICSLLFFFKFGTDGLYCVTKGNMFFRTFSFRWSADLLSVNLTSESISFRLGRLGNLVHVDAIWSY